MYRIYREVKRTFSNRDGKYAFFKQSRTAAYIAYLVFLANPDVRKLPSLLGLSNCVTG